jgi:hypothetical protein
MNKNWISVLLWGSYRGTDEESILLGCVFSLDFEDLGNNAPSKGLQIFSSRTSSWSEYIKLHSFYTILCSYMVLIFHFLKTKWGTLSLRTIMRVCITEAIFSQDKISDIVSQTVIRERLLIRRLIMEIYVVLSKASAKSNYSSWNLHTCTSNRFSWNFVLGVSAKICRYSTIFWLDKMTHTSREGLLTFVWLVWIM